VLQCFWATSGGVPSSKAGSAAFKADAHRTCCGIQGKPTKIVPQCRDYKVSSVPGCHLSWNPAPVLHMQQLLTPAPSPSPPGLPAFFMRASPPPPLITTTTIPAFLMRASPPPHHHHHHPSILDACTPPSLTQPSQLSCMHPHPPIPENLMRAPPSPSPTLQFPSSPGPLHLVWCHHKVDIPCLLQPLHHSRCGVEWCNDH
jgi:hypothetical protein